MKETKAKIREKQRKGLKMIQETRENLIKSNKAITLIALIITIIVLLILAGVSIATLTGQNGILTRAEDAKEQTGIGDEKEAIKLAYSGAVAEKRGNGDVTASDLNTEFGANGTNATATDETEGTIKVTFRDSQREYMIDADGNIADKIGNNLKTITIKDIYDLAEGDVTIQYEEGMTWGEFLSSEYNENGILELNGAITYKGIPYAIVQTEEFGEDIFDKPIDENREYYFLGLE